MKRKIGIVAGTRPEVIKMARVYWELKKSTIMEPIFISTAQHREMLDQALEIFGIQPHIDMNVMKAGQTLSDLTATLLHAWKAYFSQNKLDAILVQGDTTTAFATAIASFYAGVPIGHIEAGLRTYDMGSPFPEEMNRRLISPIATWNFVPTQQSYDHLVAEHLPADKNFITGNTVIDSLLWICEQLAQEHTSDEERSACCGISPQFATTYLTGNPGKKMILVTSHRRENFGTGFKNICDAIKKIKDQHPDLGILFPVHLNPNVKNTVTHLLSGRDRIELIPPVSYKNFIWLMSKCHLILSDSGGIQEEAPSLKKPVLIMRNTTERSEAITAGMAELTGTNVATIVNRVSALMNSSDEYARMTQGKNPFGDGTASAKIIAILEKNFA